MKLLTFFIIVSFVCGSINILSKMQLVVIGSYPPIFKISLLILIILIPYLMFRVKNAPLHSRYHKLFWGFFILFCFPLGSLLFIWVKMPTITNNNA